MNRPDFRLSAIPLVLAACGVPATPGSTTPPPSPALPADAVVGLDAVLGAMSEDALKRHVETLASDALHGRAPGTDGEEVTLAYLERHVRENYHKVTDQAGPALRYDGALDDARLLARLVLDVSEAEARPRFSSGPSLMPRAD